MSLPINIPPRIPTKGQYAITATWANGVREAIARLAARREKPTRGGGGGGSVVCSSLLPSLALDGSDWKLTISAGMSGSIVPDYAGGNLSDDPPPSTTITAATKLWLVIEWEPGSDNADGIYWITSGGSMVSSVFQVSGTQPVETAAEVAEDGTITNGVYSFLWADIVAGDTTFSFTATRCGNHQFTFCAPDSLKLMFD